MMGLTPVYIWSEPHHSDLHRAEYLRRKRVNSRTSKTKTDDRQTNIGLTPLVKVKVKFQRIKFDQKIGSVGNVHTSTQICRKSTMGYGRRITCSKM